MLELEKAVTAAESRASQMIALERTKLETMILEAKRQAQQEVLTRLNKHEQTTNDSMLVSTRFLIHRQKHINFRNESKSSASYFSG